MRIPIKSEPSLSKQKVENSGSVFLKTEDKNVLEGEEEGKVLLE